MLRAFLVLLLVAAPALETAGAQVLEVPRGRRDPLIWVGAGAGLLQVNSIVDGRTNTRWDFDYGLQGRLSLEHALGRGSTLGAVATFARLPLDYSGGEGACSRCDANANVSSLMAAFHAGGGEGFHQVIDIAAGFVRYDRFTSDAGERLAPSGDTDFAFSLGYGFGYGIGRRAELVIVQEYWTALHQRDADGGGAIRHLSTRAGLRYALTRPR